MKKLLSLMGALVILATVTVNAYAAPEVGKMDRVGPYEGSFEGTAYGDEDTSATLTLDLTHRGDQVAGNLSLGPGLYVKGGICGGAYVPSAVEYASGETVRNNPNRLVASTKVDVGRFDITVKLESDVSPSGDVIKAKAKLDLPWFCGRDPVLNATLYKTD
jgi:hypothetical protein